MPHLRFRGIEKESVKAISKELLSSLETMLGTPKTHFTIEHIDTTYILDGEENAGEKLFIEIIWVKRDAEKAQKVVDLIVDLLKPYTKADVDTIIYFTDLVNQNYYKNGVHI